MPDFLAVDRSDLLALLKMRFQLDADEWGGWQERIERISDSDFLEKLILVAANAADMAAFREEWEAGPSAFRVAKTPF